MHAPRRAFVVGGNWKCNGARQLVAELVKGLNDGQVKGAAEVVVCPPALYVDSVQGTLRKDFAVGAQNVYHEAKGAFTGEISADMLKDMGLKWTIAGHSERRTLFNESDEFVAKKTAHALDIGLHVIGCLGESNAEFESGKTEEVVYRQLAAYAAVVRDWSRFVLAYEPIWAIGTGKTATPERAEEVHRLLRAWLQANVSADAANACRILYGGSVTAANCDALAKKPNVDGFLVGGASLKAPDFITIINSNQQKQASAQL